jgi:glycosyltransferase involved in cell wall biosynthesis
MKALWLASWYPNELSPFNGDFIKRHAEAVSLFEQVYVIYVVRDEKGIITKDVHITESTTGNLTEKIIYYYSTRSTVSLLDKYKSETRYRNLYKQAIQEYIGKNGRPGIVHVHVGMKAGPIATWLKEKMGIPFVLSEHWSGFLPEAREKLEDLPFYIRSLWKKTIRAAASCSVVSKYLAEAVNKHLKGNHCRIIPNVVNTDIFYPAAGDTSSIRFVHISGLDDLKNPGLILKAFKIVIQSYPDARLEIFGSPGEKWKDVVKEPGMMSKLSFSKEVPQQVLARHLNGAVALILYSSYETFGCVVIEANACGVPVIVSDIPSMHETVLEGTNGYFAPLHNAEALSQKMLDMIQHRNKFNSGVISDMTKSLYSYPVIGKQFSEWYRSVNGQ